MSPRLSDRQLIKLENKSAPYSVIDVMDLINDLREERKRRELAETDALASKQAEWKCCARNAWGDGEHDAGCPHAKVLADLKKAEQQLVLLGERAVVDFDNATVGDVDKAVPEGVRYKDWLKAVMGRANRTATAEIELSICQEKALRFERGIMNNAPRCGACAEGLFTGVILHQHEEECPIAERDQARANCSQLRKDNASRQRSIEVLGLAIGTILPDFRASGTGEEHASAMAKALVEEGARLREELATCREALGALYAVAICDGALMLVPGCKQALEKAAAVLQKVEGGRIMEDYSDPCRPARLANEVDHLRARVAELEAALQEHHDWHFAQGPVPVEFVGMDMAAEYSDSDLCSRTSAVLSRKRKG
jgi:hypothetical protein